MIPKFIKTFLALLLIEGLGFVLMLFSSMTDESISSFGMMLTNMVQYVFGFPLVLIDAEYPFFLNTSNPPSFFILLIALNLVIQAFIILGLRILLTKFRGHK